MNHSSIIRKLVSRTGRRIVAPLVLLGAVVAGVGIAASPASALVFQGSGFAQQTVNCNASRHHGTCQGV